MTLASAIIVRAFVIGDYSIRYVDRYSDLIQPLFYRLTSYWGGLDGSIMFWVFLLSVFGAIAVKTNRERHRELIPYVVADDRGGADVLPEHHDRQQGPVRDLPDADAGGRSRSEPRCCRTRTW